MDFLYKVIATVVIGCMIFSVHLGFYILLLLILGIVFIFFILMVFFGRIEYKFKFEKPNRLKHTALKFNDIENTEIYLLDIRANRKALLLDKGYVIDIVTDSKEMGLWMDTLRYGSRSERDKDYEALIYKLKEYGLYRGRKTDEQSQ